MHRIVPHIHTKKNHLLKISIVPKLRTLLGTKMSTRKAFTPKFLTPNPKSVLQIFGAIIVQESISTLIYAVVR